VKEAKGLLVCASAAAKVSTDLADLTRDGVLPRVATAPQAIAQSPASARTV
jgi:hypothetical protein